MTEESPESLLERVSVSRRSFVTKLLVGGFTIPAVATFSTAGITPAYAQGPGASGTTTTPAPTTPAPTTPAPTTTAGATTTSTTTTAPPTTTTTTTTTTIGPR